MIENEPVVERWQAIYRGRVQGVGFRQTVQRLARRYFVTGYVRNLDDGTVELVTECPAAIFTNIDTQIRQLFGRNISDASIRSDTATDEFSRFEIHE